MCDTLRSLIVAVRRQHLEQVEELLNQSPELVVQAAEDGYTALHVALFRKNYDLVRLLLERGSDINARAADGTTPISLATPIAEMRHLVLETPYRAMCSVCCEQGDLIAVACGHRLCRECWQGHLTVDLGVRTEYKCFKDGCGASISYEDMQRFLAPSEFARYDRALFERECNRMPDFTWCPRCSAGGMIASFECNQVTCIECEYSWCHACGGEYHSAEQCQMFLDLTWKRTNTRRCPGCSVPTEHAGGCSHVRCALCPTEWCWVCQGRYKGRYSFNLQVCPCGT